MHTDLRRSFVIGRNIHANTKKQLFEGTNAIFLALLTGQSDPNVPPEIGMAVHVDDVALLHVLAVDQNRVKRTKSVQNFFFSQSKSHASVLHPIGR